ncbi:MAG TPA: alpha/beta hydrolase [Solirubrobacterales bacterium]|nr:alpha/beta hydrolase [Solirubrobacterales bacterium]
MSSATAETTSSESLRERLLAGLPVEQRRLEAGGLETAVLTGGEGPPLVLLHGPGESAVKWRAVLPSLVATNHVVAPDLPAHGESEAPGETPGLDAVLAWLDELIAATCERPPLLVGHVLGGAIAARYAIARPGRVGRLVLVDSLGLARFRPAPRFALGLFAFLARPSERNFDRFMRQCSYDLDGLKRQMGERWGPFVAYNVQLASDPASKLRGRMLKRIGMPRIAPRELERIAAPTTLIWGREDRANRLRVAERAAKRYGWQLRVIDECADDPPRDRPEQFLAALRDAS